MNSWNRWMCCFILALSCAVIVACSEEGSEDPAELEDLPEEIAVSVGEKGGTVKAKGVTLIIPEGALDKDVMISAKVISTDKVQIPSTTKDVSAVYEFGPKGTKFNKPIQVQIAMEKDEPSAKMFFTKDGDETQFEQLASVSKNASVTASTKHFSLAFAGIPRDLPIPNGERDAGAGGDPDPHDASMETPDIDPTVDAGTGGGDEDAGSDPGVQDAGQEPDDHDASTTNPGGADSGTGPIDAGADDEPDAGDGSVIEDAGGDPVLEDAGPKNLDGGTSLPL